MIMRKGLIYLVGVFGLGLAQSWLRSTMGDAAAFGLIIIYLIGIRLIAEWSCRNENDEQ
jgi:hypothetical protein